MATPLSAGVYIEERDMSTSTVGVATSVGAYVGRSVWGQPMKPTLVTNEKELADMFGEPTDDNFKDFFSENASLNEQKDVDETALATLKHLLDEGFSVVMEKIFFVVLV